MSGDCVRGTNVCLRIMMQLTPGSPAARIGLQTGDEVVEIASTSTSSLTYQQVLELISRHSDTLLMTVERYLSLSFAIITFSVENNNNNNNNNNVSLLQLQTNAAKDNQQHLPRRTVHYNRIHTKNTRSSAR